MGAPFQTSKAEWDRISAELYPHFLSWLNTNATSVDSIEYYYSTDHVYSLPARYDYEGVKKTVLVPINILGEDARKAADEARESAKKADTAAANANAAADSANVAADRADRAREDLDIIKGQAIEATGKANDAAERANTAMEEAEKKMAEFQEAEDLRDKAEQDRETGFNKAVSDFNDYSSTQKAEWAEFVSTADANEQSRKEAEQARELAEADRVAKDTERAEALEAALMDLREATGDLNAINSNPPIIRNGTWWIFSLKEKDYVDSGVEATGRSPYIDKESNCWMVWDENRCEYVNSGIIAKATNYVILTEKEIKDLWEITDPEKDFTPEIPEGYNVITPGKLIDLWNKTDIDDKPVFEDKNK